MIDSEYDLIVVGVGGVGSAAMLAGARRGWRVLGLEQFGAGHDRGSSHGQTRIIRQAYFEHPSYVPLAQETYPLWREIERQTHSSLFEQPGLLQVGPTDSEILCGVRRSANQFNLVVDEMSAQEIKARWPVFNIADDQIGLFESSAGFLRVEKCVAQMIRLAIAGGAKLRANACVKSWSASSAGDISVELPGETVRAKRIVIAPGAWASDLLAGVNTDFVLKRKQQHWFQIDRYEIHAANGMCCFLFDSPDGCFYGFPQVDELGMKIAEHTGGQSLANPSEVDRTVNVDDLARSETFLKDHFEFTKQRLVYSSVCLYTMSPDSHFLVDRFEGMENAAFAAGLSGHGFKFAPVLGEHLVDLVDGKGNTNCEFLGLARLRGSKPLGGSC